MYKKNVILKMQKNRKEYSTKKNYACVYIYETCSLQ